MTEYKNPLEQFLAQYDQATAENSNKNFLSSEKVDLLDAVLQALSTSYKVMSSREKMLQAKHNIDIAIGNYYPSIDASYSLGKTELRPGIKKDDNKTYEKTKYYGDEVYSLTLSQNLYAGGETENEIEKLKADYLVSKADFEKLLEDEVLQAVTSYMDVVFARESLEANRKNIEKLETIHEIVKVKFDAGALSVGELSNIAASVANAKSQLSRTNSSFSNALEYFKFLTGEAFSKMYPYEKITQIKISSLDQLIENAMKKNTTLRAFNYEILSSKYNIKKLKANFKPKVDFVVGAEKVTDKEDFNTVENSYMAKLKVSYNLYNGGKDQTQYLKAFSATQQKVYEKEAEVRKIKWELEKLYTSLNSLQHNLSNIENEVKASDRMVNSYWEGFRHGEQDLYLLLQGQRQLNTAELDFIKSQRDSMKDFFSILYLSGELLPYFSIDLNDENYLDLAKANYRKNKKNMKNFEIIEQREESSFVSKELENNTTAKTSQESSILDNNSSSIYGLLSFSEQFLLENADNFTIVVKGLDNPLAGLKKIIRYKIANKSFLYEFYENQKIKTHIAYGNFKTLQEAEEAAKKTFNQTDSLNYKIEKVKKIQEEFKEFSTLLFLEEKNQIAQQTPILNLEPPLKKEDLRVESNETFMQSFLSAPENLYTINLTTTSSLNAASKIIREAGLWDNSFYFTYGSKHEWVKIMIGIYDSYEEAKKALKSLNGLELKYIPVIEKIGKKQVLYQRFHSQ